MSEENQEDRIEWFRVLMAWLLTIAAFMLFLDWEQFRLLLAWMLLAKSLSLVAEKTTKEGGQEDGGNMGSE